MLVCVGVLLCVCVRVLVCLGRLGPLGAGVKGFIAMVCACKGCHPGGPGKGCVCVCACHVGGLSCCLLASVYIGVCRCVAVYVCACWCV